MEVVITADPDEAGALAASAVERLVRAAPAPVLGLATGSSPLPIYRALIERHRSGQVGFAHARAFMLDEYVGLEPGHPEAYRSFIRRELIDHIDLPETSLFSPDGTPAHLETEPRRYEEEIAAAGGIDLQILGIGSDGHIGFNEPVSSLASRTRLKTLARSTREDNARFFGGDLDAVPHHVLTQGIGTILEARHLVLIATGGAKADPVARAVEGPLSAMVPASALQLHPHATVIVDEPASAALANREYYRETFTLKPDWQQI